MTRIVTHSISLGLIGSGVFAWALAGRPLMAEKDLSPPLNPMGINGSPYGEVFAMAMQGPIETYFDLGMGSACGHQHGKGETCGGEGDHHEEDGTCEGHDHDHETLSDNAGELVVNADLPSLAHRFEKFLASLNELPGVRTNPLAAGEGLKFYLRRKAEDKLRFAYQLDPTHYGNYNSLHFFLTEPQVGTRPELTASAAKLAEDTIHYCLRQENDPRPALTAAAAASNILELMFSDHSSKDPKFSTTQMRQYLAVLDYSLARYAALAADWQEADHWNRLSPQRIQECKERLQFIGKVREASEKIIIRYEGELQNQVSN